MTPTPSSPFRTDAKISNPCVKAGSILSRSHPLPFLQNSPSVWESRDIRGLPVVMANPLAQDRQPAESSSEDRYTSHFSAPRDPPPRLDRWATISICASPSRTELPRFPTSTTTALMHRPISSRAATPEPGDPLSTTWVRDELRIVASPKLPWSHHTHRCNSLSLVLKSWAVPSERATTSAMFIPRQLSSFSQDVSDKVWSNDKRIAKIDVFTYVSSSFPGATVTERLSWLPPPRPSELNPRRVTADFRMWESCRMTPLVSVLSRRSPVSLAVSLRRCSLPTSINLIGSQGLGRLIAPKRNACSVSVVTLYCVNKGQRWRSGGAAAIALASHLGDPGSIPGGFAPGFSHVGNVLDDAARRRAPSGHSRFPRPCIPAPLHPRVSLHVMLKDDGHLRVPAGNTATRRVLLRLGPARALNDALCSSAEWCRCNGLRVLGPVLITRSLLQTISGGCANFAASSPVMSSEPGATKWGRGNRRVRRAPFVPVGDLTTSPDTRQKLRYLTSQELLWSGAEICKGGGNWRSPIKPADQRHRPARFPRVKIRERLRGESNPVRPGGLDKHYSHTALANRVQSPAGSLRIFACRNRAAGRCRWSAGFFRGSPVSPALAFRRCSILSPLHTSSDLNTSMLRAAQIFPLDKIDVKHVYTEVDFALGSQFIIHALDNSEPIADSQGNK
ncbi:hypothetical protein PR048_027437 [Dryococelus australis]|uniref:Uncharacterized protein n=1 Tax=Dryococelus australis TaxID=614101 RepID=A0ABQ9GFG7_9NEOP|nr:hypothetical protein PR048_027437 [Dryococelus australis]